MHMTWLHEFHGMYDALLLQAKLHSVSQLTVMVCIWQWNLVIKIYFLYFSVSVVCTTEPKSPPCQYGTPDIERWNIL